MYHFFMISCFVLILKLKICSFLFGCYKAFLGLLYVLISFQLPFIGFVRYFTSTPTLSKLFKNLKCLLRIVIFVWVTLNPLFLQGTLLNTKNEDCLTVRVHYSIYIQGEIDKLPR
jgi:hypothetical protein